MVCQVWRGNSVLLSPSARHTHVYIVPGGCRTHELRQVCALYIPGVVPLGRDFSLGGRDVAAKRYTQRPTPIRYSHRHYHRLADRLVRRAHAHGPPQRGKRRLMSVRTTNQTISKTMIMTMGISNGRR